MTGRDKFKKYKNAINFLVKIFSLCSKKHLIKKYNKNVHGESNYKIVLRYALIKNLCKKVGDNVYIGEHVTIKSFENLSIGDNVSIHKNCYIDATGEIEIGNDVSIATDSKIFSFNHTWDNKIVPIKYNELSLEKVVISSDVWIGASVIILAGVTISSRVVVGAGTIVTKDLDGNSLYVGNPAKKIRGI